MFEPGSRPGSHLRSVWAGMRARCLTPSHPAYRFYGANGVHVAEEWGTFAHFLDWALCSGYEIGKQLDRIDADGPYSPRNCRWTSQEINVKRRELDRAGSYFAHLGGKLTKELVETARPKTKTYKLSDGGGLVLWVLASGKKSWRYRYRFDGAEQMLTLGTYPRVPLADARELHAIAAAQVKRGANPAAMRRATKLRKARKKAGIERV